MIFRGNNRAIVALVVALVLLAPVQTHAQQPTQAQLSALLEQIVQLTQLVILLQAQVEQLQNQSLTKVEPRSNEMEARIDPTSDETITLPLYVHRLDSTEVKVRTWLTPLEIERVADDVNATYWQQAGITWDVVQVRTHRVAPERAAAFAAIPKTDDTAIMESALAELIAGITLRAGFNLFLVHDFSHLPSGGLYSGANITLVSEVNERGYEPEHTKYLIAHELGHALGLLHPNDPTNTNLMAAKGWGADNHVSNVLAPAQILQAREQAVLGVPRTLFRVQ